MNANATVTARLAEEHGIQGRPGAKVKCPSCQHRTFSIKSDDMLGKCFHTACGRFLTPVAPTARPGNAVFEVLEGVFQDFHGSSRNGPSPCPTS